MGEVVLTMLDRSTWVHLTALGDSALILPCIVLIALWLATPSVTRGLAWRWLLLASGVMAVVAASKLAFMGWLISLPGLDFTGFSGHSAAAAVVWPALGALLGARRNSRWQLLGLLLGCALALMIGISRLAIHAHSPSEVVLGLLLGGVATLGFLWKYRSGWCLPERLYVAVLSMLLVLPLAWGHRFPSQPILKHLASELGGHPAYTRRDLHRARKAQANSSAVPAERQRDERS